MFCKGFCQACRLPLGNGPAVATSQDDGFSVAADMRLPGIAQKRPDKIFSLAPPISLCIDGQIWQGQYADYGKPWSNLIAQCRYAEEARNVFERLADQAAADFALPGNKRITETLGPTCRAHRWLETVCTMPFVKVHCETVKADCPSNGSMSTYIREVPGDIFIASARTIESLAQSPQTAATETLPAVTPKQRKGDAGAVDTVQDRLSKAEHGRQVRLRNWAIGLGEEDGQWRLFQWFGNQQRWCERGQATIRAIRFGIEDDEVGEKTEVWESLGGVEKSTVKPLKPFIR
jgi:hypothetical protein